MISKQNRIKSSGFKDVFKLDLGASIVIFLIALPFSIGVAAASNAPLESGVIAAIAVEFSHPFWGTVSCLLAGLLPVLR